MYTCGYSDQKFQNRCCPWVLIGPNYGPIYFWIKSVICMCNEKPISRYLSTFNIKQGTTQTFIPSKKNSIQTLWRRYFFWGWESGTMDNEGTLVKPFAYQFSGFGPIDLSMGPSSTLTSKLQFSFHLLPSLSSNKTFISR